MHLRYAPQQSGEALIRAQTLEFRINFQPPRQPTAAVCVGFFEISERLFFIAQPSVNRRDIVRRDVFALGQRLQFGQHLLRFGALGRCGISVTKRGQRLRAVVQAARLLQFDESFAELVLLYIRAAEHQARPIHFRRYANGAPILFDGLVILAREIKRITQPPQSEIIQRRYEAAATDTLNREVLKDWGGYTQLLWGFQPGRVAGLRFERADGNGDNAADVLRDARTRLAVNMTWYTSEYSKLRVQINHDDAEHLDKKVNAIWLQMEYNIGSHAAHTF